jgi:hypothetical protein
MEVDELDTLVIEEFNPDAIEAQRIASWNFCLDADSTHKHTRGRRKALCLLTAACLLVAGTVVALVSGLHFSQQKDEERRSDFAQSINGEDTATIPPETTAPVDILETTAPVDAVETTAPVDAVETTAPVDAVETTAPVDTVETTAPVDAVETMAPVDAVGTTAPVDAVETSAPVDDTVETTAPETPEEAPGTSAPTDTSAPGDGGTTCSTMVQSDLVCYPPQTFIDIRFDNCDPSGDDWIGIYAQDPNVDLTNLGDPLTWLWTCGSQSCRGQVLVNTLPFEGNLDVGTYIAHMSHRNRGGPYASYAASPPFDISTTC